MLAEWKPHEPSRASSAARRNGARGSRRTTPRPTEQWVGFHKVGAEKKGITYKQAVDEALCFGWIDAVRRGGDDDVVDPLHAAQEGQHLERGQYPPHRGAEGAWRASRPPASLSMRRATSRSRRNTPSRIATWCWTPDYEKRFRADKKAWAWFESMPRSYRHPAVWWVMSAKQEATRERRLATLIADSAAGRKIKLLTPPGKKP